MFSHSTTSLNYFSHYGVKLDAKKDSKQSYANAIIQLLINIDREFAREIFSYMWDYKGDDKFILGLKEVFDSIRQVLELQEGKELLSSEVSLGKTPPKQMEEILEKSEKVDKSQPIFVTSDLAALYKNAINEELRWKGDEGKQWFLDCLMWKLHQLFKSDLDVSFLQFSMDNTCCCYSHKYFGMVWRDKSANLESSIIPTTKFSIVVNVEDILSDMKREGIFSVDKLTTIENRLFYFYQNQKLGNKLTQITNDRFVYIASEEYDNFLTFKLTLGEKTFKDEKASANLGFLLSLIPQYLSGDEFISDVKDDIKSPIGQLSAIVTYNYESKSYTTYVDIDWVWVMYHDKHIKQLHFIENIFENMLIKHNVPIILIYVKCDCPIQRNNQQISDMIKNYLQLCMGK